jgi:hypothetical protein
MVLLRSGPISIIHRTRNDAVLDGTEVRLNPSAPLFDEISLYFIFTRCSLPEFT